jgi:hypothetical protein
MNTPITSPATTSGSWHPSPPLGLVAAVYTMLLLTSAALYFATGFGPQFPGPLESTEITAAYFKDHLAAISWCAFLQFGAAIPFGIFCATTVSRMQFFGTRVAGVHIALFGGMLAAFDLVASSLVVWVIAHPGIAQDSAIVRTLYYLAFSFGGVGFSVPLGLFLAGICIPAAFMRLLPKWLIVFGLALAIVGELSALSLVLPKAVFLIPLTRFPAFIWLIAAGIALPNRKHVITNENKPTQQKEIK